MSRGEALYQSYKNYPHAAHTVCLAMCTLCVYCVHTMCLAGVNNPISHTKVHIVGWGLPPKYFTPCSVVSTVQCCLAHGLQFSARTTVQFTLCSIVRLVQRSEHFAV